MERVRRVWARLFDGRIGVRGHFIARWLFLRALGGIYFSAFFALLFQVKGLIGARGILPAAGFLAEMHAAGWVRFWYVPSLLWVWPSDAMLMGMCWAGLAASVLVVVNVWPRGMLVACFVSFLSFVTVAQDFSGYQSDGMLLEAGFLAMFLAPGGMAAGVGGAQSWGVGGVFVAGLGVVSDLFSVGGGEDCERRPHVAEPDGNV